MDKDDAELVRSARSGDRAAFTELVQRYQGAAYAAAFSCLGDEQDAMDAAQDAFISAYCMLGQLRRDESFGPWLRTIIRRRALGRLRSRRSERMRVEDMGEHSASVAQASVLRHERQQRHAEVHEAVGLLPAKYREVVLLHYLQRWSYRRIAAFTGLPTSTVKGRLHVARGKLKELLTSTETGVSAMNETSMEHKIEQAIYKIATEEIHQSIPMGDTENVVLFCGVDCEIEICQTEGADIVLNGTRASLGATEAKARASAAGMQILVDQVEDCYQSGPHEGELFVGTNRSPEGDPVGVSRRASEAWPNQTPQLQGFWNPLTTCPAYDDLPQKNPELFEDLQAMMRNATRMTIIREKMEDVVLSRDDWTEELQRVFVANYGDEKVSHGPAGRVFLTVGVPVERGVTVVGLRPSIRVRARDLRSDLSILGALGVEVVDVAGDVRLLDAFALEARSIEGRFIQSFYGTGAGKPRDGTYRRVELGGLPLTCNVRDIRGPVWLDGAKLEIEAAELHDEATIRNLFGTTKLHKSQQHPGQRCSVESHSGDIKLLLKENLIAELGVTAVSLCGNIRGYDHLQNSSGFTSRNDLYAILVSTASAPGGVVPPALLDVDVLIKTHDGDITIEKTV